MFWGPHHGAAGPPASQSHTQGPEEPMLKASEPLKGSLAVSPCGPTGWPTCGLWPEDDLGVHLYL